MQAPLASSATTVFRLFFAFGFVSAAAFASVCAPASFPEAGA